MFLSVYLYLTLVVVFLIVALIPLGWQLSACDLDDNDTTGGLDNEIAMRSISLDDARYLRARILVRSNFQEQNREEKQQQQSLLQKERTNTTSSRLEYGHRLAIVDPLNWLIYSHDGLHFYYISNQSNRCDPRTQLGAFELTLTSYDGDNFDSSNGTRLRQKCLNVTFANLLRIFNESEQFTAGRQLSEGHARARVDLTNYFSQRDDEEKNYTERVNVVNIVNLLIRMKLL